MPFALSVRQKLIAIVMLVCVGYAGFGAYSVYNLSLMSNASDDASDLSRLTTQVKNLEVSLLKFERKMATLTPDGVAPLNQELDDIKYTIAKGFPIRAALIDSQGASLLNQNKTILPNYIAAIEDNLQTRQALGLNDQSAALGSLNQAATELAEKLSTLASFAASFKDVRNREKDFLVYSDAAHQEALMTSVNVLKDTINNIGFGDVFNPMVQTYEDALSPVIRLSVAVKSQESTLEILSGQYTQSMDKSADYLQNTLLAQAQTRSLDTASQARRSLMMAGVLLALVTGLILSTVIHSLNRNLKAVLDVLKEVAQGKLRSRQQNILITKPDEFQQLFIASNQMSDELRQLIRHLLNSNEKLILTADELDSGIQTIVSGSERIRDRSNTLAASTEEISATADTVQAMTQSVQTGTKVAYDSATSGVNAMQNAMNSISDVADTIQDTNERVARLGTLSKEIDVVIELIVGVAEQTSLLALNAAIEAARAGEAGRGFAVVADEVKTLSEQTVKASGEITSKVENIQKETLAVIDAMTLSLEKVSRSKEQGENAVITIHEIEKNTQEAMNNTLEITQAIKEVALTTTQMAQDMDIIAHDIKDNHIATQSIQMANKNVHHQTQELANQIQRFDVA
ncbi:methyl-accepting chemotaxis protein [Marinomonas primoryensis]|uniref:Methyl-accepting chemotaxis protein n=1 Tax=Marinomonas primoryensis TaxID=178399 RepID=A0A859CRQ5_9GAMM|nr:methyl-accepting chemotaxis protein [Marinomonas primoryensis]QKK78783.1 methyl-accepting chemotaxis protein [Marinomonas primoryensis]